MLNKKYRLPSKEFPKIYTNGIKTKGRFGMLISSPSEISTPRFGFVVSSKIGNSVIRHRVTRRLREIAKEMISKYELKNTNYQYIAFEYTDDFNALRKEFEQQIQKGKKQ